MTVLIDHSSALFDAIQSDAMIIEKKMKMLYEHCQHGSYLTPPRNPTESVVTEKMRSTTIIGFSVQKMNCENDSDGIFASGTPVTISMRTRTTAFTGRVISRIVHGGSTKHRFSPINFLCDVPVSVYEFVYDSTDGR